MSISPLELYAELRKAGLDQSAALKKVEEISTKKDEGIDQNTRDEFASADPGLMERITSQSTPAQRRELANISEIFGDQDELDASQNEKIAFLSDLLGEMVSGEGGDVAGLQGNPVVDPNTQALINAANSGGADIQPPNLDNYIRNLKMTKVKEIQNKDWVNYLAANNASIKASEKLAASAR